MPVLSWAHSKYWVGHPVPPAAASGTLGYVPWQTTVIATMSLALAVRWSPR